MTRLLLSFFRCLSLTLCCLTLTAPALAAGGGGDYDKKPDKPVEKCTNRVLVAENVASYLCMESVRASVGGGASGSLLLDIAFSLSVEQKDARKTIKKRKLYLRAAYTETIMLYAGRIYRAGDVPNVDMIARMLQEDTDRLIGPDKAFVLIDTVLIQGS